VCPPVYRQMAFIGKAQVTQVTYVLFIALAPATGDINHL